MSATAPFTDTSTVIALATEHGQCDRPSPFTFTVTVQCRLVDLFALRLSHIGCAGLRVTVRTPRPVTATTVYHLAHARVVRLEITDPVDAFTTVAWFETAKAAATLGLPLIWSGSLPVNVRRHARHLPPPSDDDRWQSGWRYGLLGWRRGPGFAEVLDRRRGNRRTVVDLAALTGIFGEGLDCPSVFSGTVKELVDAGFAMSYQGEVVWLPYRLRAWPATASWVT
ncbi:MAG TPA: DUF5825 family protein [Candidatus Limnocylindrales bacterium]|nr:DUF5825 family protein [Candidatus Limnocylindrales bacterium]